MAGPVSACVAKMFALAFAYQVRNNRCHVLLHDIGSIGVYDVHDDGGSGADDG